MNANHVATDVARTLNPAVLDAATAPYRGAGRFAYHFARGKLSRDPAFAALLANGWIRATRMDPNGHAVPARVLDLGCGQGLLAALLRAAGHPARVHGIELMVSDIDRARAALGTDADFVCGDIRTTPFPACETAVILDVLHYIDPEAQQDVLARLHAALAAQGALLLRVGDADGGAGFRVSQFVDGVVTFVRGHRLSELHCHGLDRWAGMLAAAGFEGIERIPLSDGTPFANVLLRARRAGAA